MGVNLGPIYQMAFIVDDLDAAIADWVGLRAAGPFYRFDNFAFESPWCAVGHAPPDVSIALGHSGALNVELIAVHGDARTVFSGPRGLHHVARRATDVDAALAALAAAGAPTLLRASFTGGVAVGFADTRDMLGCLTELIAENAGIDAMLARMAADAAGWDGRDPIRRF